MPICDSSVLGGSHHAVTFIIGPSSSFFGIDRIRVKRSFSSASLANLARFGRAPAAKIREGESLEPKKCGRLAGGGKLGPHEDFLIELVEQDPDITLAELRGALIEAEDVTVGVPAIFRMLKRLGFTYKKRRWSRMSDAKPASDVPVTNG